MPHAIVGWALAVLVLRLWITFTLQIRAHLIQNNFHHAEDTSNGPLQLMLGLFRPLMLAFRGAPVIVSTERLNHYVRNALESEVPLYFLVAVFPASPLPSHVVQLVTWFVYARIAHMVFFLLALQPFRTLAYMPGYFLMPYLAYLALRAA